MTELTQQIARHLRKLLDQVPENGRAGEIRVLQALLDNLEVGPAEGDVVRQGTALEWTMDSIETNERLDSLLWERMDDPHEILQTRTIDEVIDLLGSL